MIQSGDDSAFDTLGTTPPRKIATPPLDSNGITPNPENLVTPTKTIKVGFNVPNTGDSDITIIDGDDANELRKPKKLDFNDNEVSTDGTKTTIFQQITQNIPKTKDELIEKLSKPEVKFVNAMFASKLLVAPALKYTTDHINNGSNKSLLSHYQETAANACSALIKHGLFFAIYAIPNSGKDYTQKALTAKIGSDFIYNTANAVAYMQMSMLQKMVSLDYAKELSFWALPGVTFKALSMTGLANYLPNPNEIYEKSPVITGAVLGIGSEMVDFGQALYNKAASLVMGEASSADSAA